MADDNPGGPAAVESEQLSALRAQLQLATQTAQQAYRDSSRLIRLLGVIGRPVPPDELIDGILGELSDVFSADFACLVYADGARVEVLAARGFGEDDENRRLPLLPGIADLLVQHRPAGWLLPDGLTAPQVAG